MTYLAKIEKTLKQVPRRTVIYGVPGVGKSTLAANLYGIEHTVFIPTEDGLSNIDVAAFPLATTYLDALGPVMELGNTHHPYRCVVIDSADWLEQLIWRQVCEDGGKKAITDFDFGKGYGSATQKFMRFLQALNGCRDRGMHVIIVAHSTVSKFSSPEGASFDRYGIKMHRDAEAILHEWADEVFFAQYETFVATQEEGFGKTRGVGVGDGKRILKCEERPAFLAKNRLGMPPEIDMRVSIYQQYFKAAGLPPAEEGPVEEEEKVEEEADESGLNWDKV